MKVVVGDWVICKHDNGYHLYFTFGKVVYVDERFVVVVGMGGGSIQTLHRHDIVVVGDHKKIMALAAKVEAKEKQLKKVEDTALRRGQKLREAHNHAVAKLLKIKLPRKYPGRS